LEVNTQGNKPIQVLEGKAVMNRFRPMPLCSPVLLPPPHALALRMLLQWGVQPSWFDVDKLLRDTEHLVHTPGMPSTIEKRDFRHYMLDTSFPLIGDTVVPELLLKILEPYRKAGQRHMQLCCIKAVQQDLLLLLHSLGTSQKLFSG